ncbi:MAG: protein kinase [Myxococcales bacterium]|nr:protein kinase [Myxococcales bacterium]
MHSALPPAEDLKLVQLADIARGGMGVVQLSRVASGRLSGRHVAVKRLNPAIEQEPEFVNMFLDETWITATINSPHVVKVEAWGRDEYGLYLAVELVEGVSLSRLIKESKEMKEPFAERTVAFILSQICSGLAAAHGLRAENGQLLGVVHRDLTPGNILIGFDGLVKIADFGIAKAEERLTSTRIGMMKGKPAYMAPEQARGGGIDLRADLFALGVVMFELLADRRPWTAKNDLETLIAVSTSEPPSLQEIRKVSPVFSEIVDRCLKKRPDDRFSSASEIKERLDAWRRERGFDVDDASSLAAFVRRNTPQQQAWFAQALSGGLRLGGVTFSDLEAKIDAGRKSTDGAQPAVPVRTPQGAPAAPPPPAQLDDIDENAQTRFMGGGAALAQSIRSSSLGGTVALTATESHKLGARLVGPQSARPDELPLPPPRTGGPARSISTSSFSPQSAGPAQSAPFSSGPPSPAVLSAPQSSGPVSPHPFGGAQPMAVPLAHPPADISVVPPTEPRKRAAWVWVLPLVVAILGGTGALYWFVIRARYGV